MTETTHNYRNRKPCGPSGANSRRNTVILSFHGSGEIQGGPGHEMDLPGALGFFRPHDQLFQKASGTTVRLRHELEDSLRFRSSDQKMVSRNSCLGLMMDPGLNLFIFQLKIMTLCVFRLKLAALWAAGSVAPVKWGSHVT